MDVSTLELLAWLVRTKVDSILPPNYSKERHRDDIKRNCIELGLTSIIKNRMMLVEGGIVHLCCCSTSLSDSGGCLSESLTSPNQKLYKILKH